MNKSRDILLRNYILLRKHRSGPGPGPGPGPSDGIVFNLASGYTAPDGNDINFLLTTGYVSPTETEPEPE